MTSRVVLKLTLPFDPMPSPRPRVRVISKFASVYMPKEYMEWKEGVAEFVKSQGTVPPAEVLELPVTVKLAFHVQRPKTTKLSHPKPDIDNYAKSVLDAFNDAGCIWADDTQVVDLKATKEWTSGPGKIVAEVIYG